MNRQRSFSFKLPSRSLVFYVSIPSSFIFLTFIIIWLNKTTTPSNSVPVSPQVTAASCLQYFNTTSSSSQVLGFRPPTGIAVPPLQTNLTGNFSANFSTTVNAPPEDPISKYMKGTPSSKPDENAASGFSGNISSLKISGVERKENQSQMAQHDLHDDDDEDIDDGELDGSNFTEVVPQNAPPILFDKIEIRTGDQQNAPLNKTEGQNATSGFSGVNPLISGLQRKEDESQGAQDNIHHDEEDRGGELVGNFTTVAQSAPAPLLSDKIEIRTEDHQNAPLNKIEEQNAASGYSDNINSLIWLQKRENESQVTQPALHDEQEDGAAINTDDKIEIRTEEQNAELSKKIVAKSRKRRGKKKKTRPATSFDETTQSSSSGLPVEEDKRSIINLGGCDFSTRGRWVYDESYPLYTNRSCPFIGKSFDCPGNGRLDNNFMKWRWQPQDCDIPRFDATKMLERMRGKRLVFVGDSLNRNQWESMVCMLMGGKRGLRITRVMGNFKFIFLDYKCTGEFYTSPFLVNQRMERAGQKQVQTLQIDSIDQDSSRWRGADILVFDTGHWWNYHKTNSGINFYQEGGRIHPYLDTSTALRKALMTWAAWVDKYTNPHKTRVFFRSLSPTHFSGGQWNTGGGCKEATQPLLQASRTAEEANIIAEEVIKQMKTHVTSLNITSLSEYRIDGHPSKYGANNHLRGIQDCSHWCLPGIPDVWNQLLYLHLMSV